ncbi:MAG: DUF1641 domain-containing protein [Hydrogenibacillus schlegelii]|nr:DUF1641 domain-containing protein [Hydrogenibacillus schlegelii]
MLTEAVRELDLALDRELVERLSDPATIERLIRLLDKLETVEALVEMIDGFFRRGPELADSVNGLIQVLRDGLRTPEIAERIETVFQAGRRVQEVLDSPAVRALFEEDVLDTRSIALVGKVARAMQRAAVEAAEPSALQKRVGMIGLLRALSDPELQPALNFVFGLARHLSRELTHA